MERIPVKSSNLKSVGYSEAQKSLEIEFHGGEIYQYSPVEPEVYEELMNAKSLGKYFAANIRRNSDYIFIRIR